MSRRKKSKKKWPKILGIIVALFIVAGGVLAFSVYRSLNSAVDTMHTPIDRDKSDKRDKQVTLDKKEPFSVLMLGVDERKGDRGRSDSMIVMTVNPEKKSVKMLSIPRDTRTEIVGKGTQDKINHAYAFGGVEMSMDTVENFLDIPIDYYMKINMEGFKDVVDAVGGVTVDNQLDFTYEGVHFEKGPLTLNGQDALKYSRMRYDDPNGDFGRQSRQRQVIEAVVKEGASFSSLSNYGDILKSLSDNIQTNLTFNEMVDIQKNYRTAAGDIEQLNIQGTGTKIGGVYYLQVNDDEKKRLQNMMQEHLVLKN
ncbi:polyisoprenyl-teichoic acid--peptidoglycan teichoic acid transferase TagU [Bacillus massiliglaciei]|uniref:polyisoprenyl-teichoic acid--peptidoglycan teichoic acid transferase TagU n=1 Tax=Bacillus massiliglaciei TaxID=1816693 RepID=UPI000A7A4E56|nr:LytR family transcriptional regulator [Bacillus massiliglaciei]